MATLSAIRTALATLIDDNTDLTGYANAPEQVNLPAFVVVPRIADFQVTFARGSATYEFSALVLISRRDDGLAQDDLDEYLSASGANSIWRIVFANQSLGLTDGTQAVVRRATDYGAQFDVGGMDHVGVRFEISVTTPGTA